MPNFIQRTKKLVSQLLIATLLAFDMPMLPLINNVHAAGANNWVTVPVKADPMMQGLNIPLDASTKGMWSNVNAWPLNGLHTAVLPDGRILTYGSPAGDGFTQDGRTFDIWDSTLGFGANSHITTYLADQQDSFCSSATFLTDGRMLISGGNSVLGGVGTGTNNTVSKTSNIFSPTTNTIETSPFNLAQSRWYASMITLADGRPIILGGMVPYSEDSMFNNPDLAVASGLASMTPEVFEVNGWRSLLGANSREAFGPDFLRANYPRAFVAPNGQLFGLSGEKMWYLDPNGNGSIAIAGIFKGPYSATAPINVGSTNNVVMYAPGKLLVLGGNGGRSNDDFAASNLVTSIDINGATPVVTEQPAMTHARRMANSIVLADGRVVVTGGTKFGNFLTEGVYAAEIFTPATVNTVASWTLGSSAAMYRGYHSSSALLPNGTILSTGGSGPIDPKVNTLSAEIYYPPYLFKSVAGVSQLAVRPVIKAISSLSYANNVTLQLDMENANPISQLVLIGLSKGTHDFNSGQRRIPLTFTQNNFRLTSTTPNANLTPPGYYQVVALDANGVPSLGTIVAIGQGVTPPQVPVTPYNPPDLTGAINAPGVVVGGIASYTVTAVAGTTYSWNFGDGSADTPNSANPAVTHTYTQAGAFLVTLSAKDSAGAIARRTFIQAVATAKTVNSPTSSSSIIVEKRNAAAARVWVVNPDDDTVSVMDSVTNTLVAEIPVGLSPRSVAIASNGNICVVNKGSASISIIDPNTLKIVATINLPVASQPHGIAFAPDGTSAFIALEATGQLIKLNAATGAQLGLVNIGLNVRHVAVTADSSTVLVSRFITPPLPGESTAIIDTSTASAEVLVVNAANMTLTKTIRLKHSDKVDAETQGAGIPNYLAAAAISPDGKTAWVPSKQDNIKRGVARNGQNLDFQNTIRAISSRIDMTSLTEDYVKRIDHDNSSVGSAAVYHPNGVYLFVALETSRQVAVIDAISGNQLFRIETGRAPQGLTLAADGNTLYVQDFMDRTVSVFDLSPLTTQGIVSANLKKILLTVNTEKLSVQALLGKQLFYDAKDTRLARDSYMSCASCHNDGSHDGRVWDFTGFGEGLRNTIALKGRAGMAHGFLHWSGNFDEVQDFEKQIRDLSGGLGLLSNTDYNTGTRIQALGDKKSGLSVDLDNLAAYVASLNIFAASPNRNADGSLTATAVTGKALFNANCASCHAGNPFTNSFDANAFKNIGTINALSGKRLGANLTSLDVPTLRDVWATAPYLHNGSAQTLTAAVQAHNNINLNATDLANVVAYVQQIGNEVFPLPTVAQSPIFGGQVGTAFTDNVDSTTSLTGLTIKTGWWIDSIQGLLALRNLDEHGGTRGEVNNVTWPAGEYLVRMFGQSGSLGIVGKINFVTNTGRILGPYGAALGQDNLIDFDYTVPVGNRVVGFSGRSSTSLNAIGLIYGPLPNVQPANVAPTITLTAPANNAAVTQGTAIAISANAADTDGTITKVEFYDGATLLNTVTAAPYIYNWPNAAIGTHIITAKAYDNIGAVSTSAAVNVTIKTPNVVPTVSLTAPTANATFLQGVGIVMNATASDIDGTIAKVEFYDGATLISTDATQPYSFTFLNAANGVHNLTAKAYDNVGAVATSVAVNVTVNQTNVAPTITLTAPANNAAVTQGTAIAISANAADTDGTITKVEFYDGATLLNTVTAAPYIYNWPNAAIGTHIITAKAYDNIGAVSTSAAVNVTIKTPNVVPTVSLTAPTANATFLQGVGIVMNATASDIDGTIAKVEFYDGATLISTDATQPYSFTFLNAANGVHNLTAKAYDNVGAVATSVAVNVTVNQTNVAPTVNLTSPLNNSAFLQSAMITLSANAVDSDGSIAKVEFYDDTTLLNIDIIAPYSFVGRNATVGLHSVTAKAYDNQGAVTTTATANVTINATSAIFGAAAGTAFTDNVPAGSVLTSVVVKAGSWIDSIQGLATPANLPAHGGTGGTLINVTWPAAEYLVRIFGQWGSVGSVAKISFATNTGRVLGPYGAGTGQGTLTNFDYTVPVGTRIKGFIGRSGNSLNAIGVVYGK